MEALQYRNMPIGNFSDNGIGNKLFEAGTAFWCVQMGRD